jgi:hypothetical protein
MDTFIKIKKKTHDVIVRNMDKTDIVDKWKSNIRDKLVLTKITFNKRIDRYIDMFSERFRHIEEAQIMINEKGEPSRLNDESKSIKDTLDELKTFHNEILRIFEKISNSPAEQRIKLIDKSKDFMRHIEQKSDEYDKKIARCTQRLNQALEESFPLKDIDKRLEQRILKFFQREYRKKFKLPLDGGDDLNQTRDLVTITRGGSDVGHRPEERMLADLDVSDIN